MKKLALAFIFCGVAYAGAAQSLRSIRRSTATFTVNGETISYQRIANTDINRLMARGGSDYKVAMALKKMQPLLDDMRMYVSQHREINFRSAAEDQLNDIKRANTDFDHSAFERELDFYTGYIDPKEVNYTKADDKLLNRTVNAPSWLLLDTVLDIDKLKAYNDMVLGYVNGYNLIARNERTADPSYTYTTLDFDKLTFNYYSHIYGANADLKITGRRLIDKQQITGQFLTMLEVYNGIFGVRLGIEEAQVRLHFHGFFYYHGVMFNYYFSPTIVDGEKGYWMLELYRK